MRRSIAVLVGSLRKDSINRKVADAVAEMAPEGLALNIVEIGELPFYNEDMDGDDPPAAWTVFRKTVAAADAVLFVSPEYNRSVPAVLKNAIDVGSRPYGSSVWSKKPGAVLTVSPGAIGGFGANHHLRQMTVFLDIPMMQQPESYLGNAGSIFGDDGSVSDERARKLLQLFIDAYADWVEKILRGPGELA